MSKRRESHLLFAGAYRIASWLLILAQVVYLFASGAGIITRDAQVFWMLYIASIACVARADALRALSELTSAADDGGDLGKRQ